jgi:hypothetical protein
MAQDLRDVAPDIAADMKLLQSPNLSTDQLLGVIARIFERSPALEQKATQTIEDSRAQLRPKKQALQDELSKLKAKRESLSQLEAKEDLAKLDKQIQGLEDMLSTL